jgi:fructokinase
MRIGVDLGGTKIEAVALDHDGAERFRRRIATPVNDYGATVEAVGAIVGEAERAIGRGTVGVGIPGTISPATGLVKNANSTWLIGQPLKEDLERRLRRPVRIANDANCFALSEATDGAAAGAPVVFGVIVGTGTGGGLVANGRVLVGPNSIAGEWGHNPMPWPEPDEWPGPPCYCGRTGCIETFLSGPGLARDHERRTGQRADAAVIVRAAAAGDAAAAATLERYERRMARGLAAVMNVVDPDVIVLGGGVSQIERLYTNVPRLWGRFVFSDAIVTRLVRARHGDSSGVRGAAWLWPGE